MPDETTESRQKRYVATRCQQLIKDHAPLLVQLRDEVLRAYSGPIPLTDPALIAVKYAEKKGAEDAINLFIKRIHDKANE